MNLFCLYYQFKFSTASTACAPLETGGGTACQICFRCGSSEITRILQGVCMVPIYMFLGLVIQAQNPIKTQNKDYEKKD